MAVILGALAWLIWPALNNDCSGTTGDAIPTEPPDEARRLQHPAGFSVVVPPDWEPAGMPLRKSDPMVRLFPAVPKGKNCPVRRAKAGLVISNLGTSRPADLGSFRRITFQGQRAYERMEVRRESTFDDPAQSEYRLYVQTDGGWFAVDYFIAEGRTTLPPMIRDYIGTLRWR